MSVFGLRVGPFEIVDTVRVPAPGHWYVAQRVEAPQRSPRRVLIHLVPPDADTNARTAVQRQYSRLAVLEDPRVPRPVDYYEGLGALALVADIAAPLQLALNEQQEGRMAMPFTTALSLISEVCEVMESAHARKVVHGHLDGKKVAIDPAGRMWVWGFGTTGMSKPNRSWMPPELSHGESPTPASDQWAVGALFGALLTGFPPWKGADNKTIHQGDVTGFIADVAATHPEAASFIARMMALQPNDRFPSFVVVRQQFALLEREFGGDGRRAELASVLDSLAQAQEEADRRAERESTVQMWPPIRRDASEADAEPTARAPRAPVKMPSDEFAVTHNEVPPDAISSPPTTPGSPTEAWEERTASAPASGAVAAVRADAPLVSELAEAPVEMTASGQERLTFSEVEISPPPPIEPTDSWLASGSSALTPDQPSVEADVVAQPAKAPSLGEHESDTQPASRTVQHVATGLIGLMLMLMLVVLIATML